MIDTKNPRITYITDPGIIREYAKKEDSCIMASYPRSGQHLFRMLCELYFNQPNLRRSYFVHDEDRRDYLMCIQHGIPIECEDYNSKNLVYLYRRDIPSVIFSRMYTVDFFPVGRYHDAFEDWVRQYDREIPFWLTRKSKEFDNSLILNYEDFVRDPYSEFYRACKFFEKRFYKKKFEKAYNFLTKENVKKWLDLQHPGMMKSVDDPDYEEKRENFRNKYSKHIVALLEKNGYIRNNDEFMQYFKGI